MQHTRWIKFAIVAVIVIGAAALSLALLTGTSEAAGPGNGRGNGQGGNGGGNGGGVSQGNGGFGQNGQQIQDGTGLYDPLGGQMQGQGAGGYGQGGIGLTQQGSNILVDLPPATPGPLPADVIAALTAGINDEYNAYAIYGSIIDQFGVVRPFTNIQQSEQGHIDALAFLFDRYGLAVPGPDVTFIPPQFATLNDACAAGAAAEVANFALYDAWIATVSDYPDLVQVFTALRDTSEFQHLPAFERCAG